jgi:hypothetical protein
VAYFNLLTPEKGTSFYDRIRQQDRVINESEIGRWPGQPRCIKPLYCSPRELEEHMQSMHRRFYSLPSMFRRLPVPFNTSAIASWTLNLSQHRVSAHVDKQNQFNSY